MDKIQTLLQKAGVKPELAKQICESLGNYKRTLREQYNTEYAAKVAQAKKVCIEETEAHKRELSRRLQIFLETKSAAVEASLVKQSALNESEALTRLSEISTIVTGAEPNGRSNGNATALVEKFKQKAQVAKEEKNKAIALANRKTAVAEKALKHNRALTTENAKLKKHVSGQTVTEGRQQKPKKRRRIDKGRKSTQARSTRSTLLENQDRRPPAQPNDANTRTSGNGYSVRGIAEGMDEDLI